MIKSMTGFGSQEARLASLGKASIELRSSNHKFLEIVFHLPVGFLSLEDKMKKEIEAKIKRGRLSCVVNITGGQNQRVFLNKDLLKTYLEEFEEIKKEFKVRDEIGINTLIHLPGVLSLEENRIARESIWPKLKILLRQALEDLVKMRLKEGRALGGYLKNRGKALKANLFFIEKRFKKAIQDKLEVFVTDEERNAFLKDTDITEEIERLVFHIRNFSQKLRQAGPIGKELDFIAQEMQREANTLAAKSFDTIISSRIVQVKSQIEKIREQVQNIE